MAAFHDRSIDQVAGIVAVLSPGLAWKQNLMSAKQVLLGFPSSVIAGYGPNKKKAHRIACGSPIVSPQDINGPKVSVFYRLIRDCGNDRDVCVDGHAANMALGRGKRRLRDSDTSQAEIELVQEAFRLAARQLKLKPCWVQAATWIAWRSSNGFQQGRLEF